MTDYQLKRELGGEEKYILARKKLEELRESKAKSIMKKLSILFILLFFSCKKADINPEKCFTFITEKVTVYGLSAGEIHYQTGGLPIVERSTLEVCNQSEKSLLDLLKSMNSESKSGGVCITYHTIMVKGKIKK